jgi:hypothetical protein
MAPLVRRVAPGEIGTSGAVAPPLKFTHEKNSRTKRPDTALIDDQAGTVAEFDQILTAEIHAVFQISADDLRLAQHFRFSRRK